MKTPPFLLGTALLFWGWQSGFLVPGVIMAVVLEGAGWWKARWDFSEQDFTRIWVFCSLVLLGAVVYAFTTNEGPSDFRGFFQNPNFVTQRNVGLATGRAAAAVFRWLPMIFFLFISAQAYNSAAGVPVEAISRILRRRWQRARKMGRPVPTGRSVNVSYPYLALCLFAASVHPSDNNTFFWGLAVLLGWALWPHRPPRFGLAFWTAALAGSVALGYLSQRGLGQVQHYLGSLNPQFFSTSGRHHHDAAQTRTGLGRIGRLKASARILLRLDTRGDTPPALLREASYRTFSRGRVWSAESNDRDEAILAERTNAMTFVLLRGKTNVASVNIACYLDGGKGLLPLPSGCGLLEKLPAYGLHQNALGAVDADGPGLVIFDAHYGPGATIDSPAKTSEDLQVPTLDDREPALEQVVNDLHLRGQNLDQALQTLRDFFLKDFTYRTWQQPTRFNRTNDTPLTRFLLRTKSGHCEYFASAGVLLLRQAGFPARYAVGYAVHEGANGQYVVRERDAHAWCLVWNAKHQRWQDVDFTPPIWIQAETRDGSRVQALADFWSWLGFEISKFRWGQTHLRQYLLWTLIPVLLVLLYQIVFHSRRRRGAGPSHSAVAVEWPGLDSEFYQLERKLGARGLARQVNEPLSHWLERASAHDTLAHLKPSLKQLLNLHYRYRFDPQGLGDSEREVLRREARTCVTRVETAGKSQQYTV